jgi:hypothetical protein
MMFDLDSRELLRVRPNPLNYAKIIRLRGVRPAGPPPRPSIEPVRAQRRASNSGVIMICGQKIALGRVHAHRTVTVHVSETTLAIELADGDTRVARRTTTQPVRNIKNPGRHGMSQCPRPMSQIMWHESVADQTGTRQRKGAQGSTREHSSCATWCAPERRQG